MKKQPKPLLEYTGYADTDEIRDYQLNHNEQITEKPCKTCGHTSEPEMSFNEARDAINSDSDYWTFQWEWIIEELTELMNKKTYWQDNAHNMGWQSRQGEKVFEATNGQDFIDKITPNTSDFSFRIYKYKTGFKVIISHHDAPMGETHLIKPLSEKQYNKLTN